MDEVIVTQRSGGAPRSLAPLDNPAPAGAVFAHPMPTTPFPRCLAVTRDGHLQTAAPTLVVNGNGNANPNGNRRKVRQRV